MENNQNLDIIYDPLTHIYNRRGFFQIADSIIHCEDQCEYVLVFCNIRNFKVINEIHGTAIGDEILISLANTINDAKPIACARLDSDRFIYLIHRKSFDVDNLVEFSKRTFVNDQVTINYSIRFGVYRVKDKSLSINAMCDRAKAAKRYIRDEYYVPYSIWDESMREDIVNEEIFAEELKPALDNRQFIVYYQPIVDVKTKKIVSAEALVRWNHPELGFISPAKFIPVFEKNASISKLDYFVGSSVSDFIKNRLNNGQHVVPISVNSSRMDFNNHGMDKLIMAKLNSIKLPPKYVRLEITESTYAIEPIKITKDLELLRDNGIKILLDDFGSGYSSFNTLHNVDVDIIKVDMKFFEGFHDNPKCKIIISSIIDMAHKLGLKIIAEGVEDKKEYEFLLYAHCDYIQGYYLYKPMAESEFAQCLDNDTP